MSSSRTELSYAAPQAGRNLALLQTHQREIVAGHLFTAEVEHCRDEGCGSGDDQGRASFSPAILNYSAWPQTCILPLARHKSLS